MNNTKLIKHILVFLLTFVTLAGLGLYFLYSRIVQVADGGSEINQGENVGKSTIDILNNLTRESLSVRLPAIRPVDSIKDLSQVILPEKSLEIISADDKEPVETNITKEEVIMWTNIERANSGLVALKENETLNLIAQRKLNDMFARNYFAHLSLDGQNIGDLATSQGYHYAIIGENLALGNFADGVSLVTAWMNSLGHRENILKSTFTNIGVAVGLGSYQGRTTFMAVQVFAKSLATCRLPDSNLKNQITDNKIAIVNLYHLINNEKEKIEKEEYHFEAEYKEAIKYYNDLINNYNNLIRVTEASVAAYNKEVKEYNVCISN